MTHQEQLKSMLHDIINDRAEQAEVTLHNYFVSKTREVSGLGEAPASVKAEPVASE